MTVARRTVLKNMAGSGGLALACRSASLAAAITTDRNLPGATPEAMGMASSAILNFLDAAQEARLELHSLMIVRHGHVIAEGWWAPYRRDAVHILNSLSKSFTSTAVGLAVGEGRLKLTDKVISFFPDKLPEVVNDNLAKLNVQHLLTMSIGHTTDSLSTMTRTHDWAKTFLEQQIAYKPGTTFLYDSGGTYMLSAIVQKVTGQRLVDYLQPRLFEPLGVSGMRWDTCPLGVNVGTGGLSVTTDTLAKFGQVYLRKGMWRDKQILPEKWVEEATSFHIQQNVDWGYGVTQGDAAMRNPADTLKEMKRISDWYQGYGYQFWRCRHGAYRGDGAFSQFAIVMPDQDAVVAITGNADMQKVLNLVWQHILPAAKPGMLPPSREARALVTRLEALSLPGTQGASTAGPGEKVGERHVFSIEPNEWGVDRITLDFANNHSSLLFYCGKQHFAIRCGHQKRIDNIVDFPKLQPELEILGNSAKAVPLVKVSCEGRWKDNCTYEMMWRYYETPYHDIIRCTFDGDKLRMVFESEYMKRPALTGKST